MLKRLVSIAGVLSIAGAVSVHAACSIPGQDVCHDPEDAGKYTCTTLGDDRWTYTDGTPIGKPLANNTFTAADYKGCYCQISDVDDNPLENHVVVTRCTGQNADVRGAQYGGQIYAEGYANWWDGKVWMSTGYNGGEVATSYMNCREDLTLTSQVSPSGVGTRIVYITWTNVTAVIEAPLPSNAAADPAGLCPGYDVQADYYPNTDPAATPIAASDAVNCTCQTTNNAGIDDQGDGEDLNSLTFATICSEDFNRYWNGRGYRTRRSLERMNNGNSLVGDNCQARTVSDWLVANVRSTSNSNSKSNGKSTPVTSSSGSTNTGTSSSSNTSGSSGQTQNSSARLNTATLTAAILAVAALGSAILL